MTTNSRVLIIGAGPSGLALAIELTRRGISCDIVDKAMGPAPLPESRALAFNARSQMILEASGVTDIIKRSGHTVDRVRICWQGKLRKEMSMLTRRVQPERDIPISSAFDALDSRSLIVIRQGEIERIMIDYLQSQGVAVQWNTELCSFSETENSVTATLISSAGKPLQLVAGTIVGCDGAHSIVRKLGGYSFDGESDPQTWSLLDATMSDSQFAHALTADLYPGKAFVTIAISDNVVRLIHNGKHIRAEHPMMQYCKNIHWESEFNISYRLVERYQRGRSFLCGDAAHVHSPVGGRGMNLGIEDAACLAWLLAEGREAQYSGLRLPIAKKILKATFRQTMLLNASSPVSSLAKQFGPKLFAVPLIGRSLKRSVLGLDTANPEWLA
ncbi:hypothetical protein AB833_31675 [Chromatiales bacterium (ex Bugula neritina AB1)]|nr:hypothetical protein AB833_31675 [Chromatiales bacterium (ex Bugula neritina AB1)]